MAILLARSNSASGEGAGRRGSSPCFRARRSMSRHMYAILTGLRMKGMFFCSNMIARTENGRQRDAALVFDRFQPHDRKVRIGAADRNPEIDHRWPPIPCVIAASVVLARRYTISADSGER